MPLENFTSPPTFHNSKMSFPPSLLQDYFFGTFQNLNLVYFFFAQRSTKLIDYGNSDKRNSNCGTYKIAGIDFSSSLYFKAFKGI